MKIAITLAACVMLSACAGTANIVDRGNVKEIVYSGFADAPGTASNTAAMQALSMKECPGGYHVVTQIQKRSEIVWVVGCENVDGK